MKLKRLLSGVTAAVMALSSVAIASFTSASASELADKAFIQWSGKWVRADGKDPAGSDQTGLIDEGTSKGGMLVQNWGSGWQLKISEVDLTGMKNPSIEVEISDGGTFQVYTEKDDGKGGTVPDVNFGIGKSGEPVLIPEDYRGESASFLLSALDASGAITKISVYDHPNPPAQPVPIESITYNFTVTEGGNASITITDGTTPATIDVKGVGDEVYTLKRTLASPSVLINQLGFIENTTDPVTKLMVKTIVINEKYTFEVNKEINADGTDKNALPHVYDGTTINTPVIYKCDEAYLSGSSSGISLVLGTPPETDNPSQQTPANTNNYSGTTYNAQLSYCDTAISFDARGNDKTYGGPIAEIGGTYTLGINVSDFKNWVDQVPSGITCLYIDMLGMAKAFGANTTVGVEKGKKEDFDATRALAVSKGLSVTNLSIIADGKEKYKYKDSDIYFGDFEGNGNLRIDLINNYTLPPCPTALDGIAPFFSATDKIEVKFTITTPLTKSSNTVAPKKNPTTVNAKKAAQAKVKNAKIKNLSVKSKAKKKISVSWKKVNKVNGYQVQVAKNKNFKGKNIILKKFTKKAKLTVKSSKIKSKKSYFVRVRAYATYKNSKNKTDKVYGKFSAKKKVKVK